MALRLASMRACTTGICEGSTSSSSAVFRPLARVAVSITDTAATFTISRSISRLFSCPISRNDSSDEATSPAMSNNIKPKPAASRAPIRNLDTPHMLNSWRAHTAA